MISWRTERRKRWLPNRPRVRAAIAVAVPRRGQRLVRWLVIVTLLLVVVLGGLYEFNRFRTQAIANFFAHNKPPPAQISAVVARTQSVPRFAPGIGSITAVHQVTVNPEVGGRVTKIFFEPGQTVKAGDPLVQINDAPDQGDLANYQAQRKLAQIKLARSDQLVKRQFTPQETVDQNQSQLAQMNALIQKTEAVIAQKLIRAPFGGQLGIRQIDLGQYLNPGAPIVTLTDLSMLYVNFTLPSQHAPGDLGRAAGQRHLRRVSRPNLRRQDHDDRAAAQPRYPDDRGPGDDGQPG